MALSSTQELTVSVATWLASLFSIFGSCTLITIVLNHQKYKVDGYHRLLLGLSIFDIFSSMGWALGPLVPPKDSSTRHMAIGTIETCTVGGFLFQMGLGSVLYNAMLSIYFVMVIRYGITKRQLTVREWFLHGIPILFSVVTATSSLPLTLFNENAAGTLCWIARNPVNCNNDNKQQEGGIPCTRGGSSTLFGYLFGVLPMLSVPTVLVCNVLIYWRVRNTERASRRYNTRSPTTTVALESNYDNNDSKVERAKKVLVQSTLYVLAFLNSTLWNIAIRNLDGLDVLTRQNEQDFFLLILAAQFFSPFQGFLNLVIYVRPRYVRMRERHSFLSRVEALQMALENNETTSSSHQHRASIASSSSRPPPRLQSRDDDTSSFATSLEDSRRKLSLQREKIGRDNSQIKRKPTIAEIVLRDDDDDDHRTPSSTVVAEQNLPDPESTTPDVEESNVSKYFELELPE